MAYQRRKMSPFTNERLHSGRKILGKEAKGKAKEKTMVALPLENAKKEYGDDLRIQPKWSETAHLKSRGSEWLVPPEWHNEVPRLGTGFVC